MLALVWLPGPREAAEDAAIVIAMVSDDAAIAPIVAGRQWRNGRGRKKERC